MKCIYTTPENYYGIGRDFKSHSPKQWFYELEDKDYKEAKEQFLDALMDDGEILREAFITCEKPDGGIEIPIKEIIKEIPNDAIGDAIKYYFEHNI